MLSVATIASGGAAKAQTFVNRAKYTAAATIKLNKKPGTHKLQRL
jgi:hypothetical protein